MAEYHVDSQGSIPARAGKPSTPGETAARWWVDPRARGEASAYAQKALDEEGRSPRARGSLVRLLLILVCLGSIPARAGKPAHQSLAVDGYGVDPRARGEAENASNAAALAQGRSPRARGSP